MVTCGNVLVALTVRDLKSDTEEQVSVEHLLVDIVPGLPYPSKREGSPGASRRLGARRVDEPVERDGRAGEAGVRLVGTASGDEAVHPLDRVIDGGAVVEGERPRGGAAAGGDCLGDAGLEGEIVPGCPRSRRPSHHRVGRPGSS